MKTTTNVATESNSIAPMPADTVVKTARQIAAEAKAKAKADNAAAEANAKAQAEAKAKRDAEEEAKAQADALIASIDARVMSKDELKAQAFSRLSSLLSVESMVNIADLFENLNKNSAQVGAFVKSHGSEISGEKFDDRLADKASVALYDKDGNFKGNSSSEKRGLAVIRYAGFAVSPQALSDAPTKTKNAIRNVKMAVKLFEAYGIKQNIVKAIGGADVIE